LLGGEADKTGVIYCRCTDHPFTWEQAQQHRSLGIAAHHGQVLLIDFQAQQATGAAAHHEIFSVLAKNHPLEDDPFLEFENGRGPAGQILEVSQRQPLEATVTAEQADAFSLSLLGQGQQLHDPLTAHALRQELFQGPWVLTRKLPAQQGHTACVREGQQGRTAADRQDQAGG